MKSAGVSHASCRGQLSPVGTTGRPFVTYALTVKITFILIHTSALKQFSCFTEARKCKYAQKSISSIFMDGHLPWQIFSDIPQRWGLVSKEHSDFEQPCSLLKASAFGPSPSSSSRAKVHVPNTSEESS